MFVVSTHGWWQQQQRDGFRDAACRDNGCNEEGVGGERDAKYVGRVCAQHNVPAVPSTHEDRTSSDATGCSCPAADAAGAAAGADASPPAWGAAAVVDAAATADVCSCCRCRNGIWASPRSQDVACCPLHLHRAAAGAAQITFHCCFSAALSVMRSAPEEITWKMLGQ